MLGESQLTSCPHAPPAPFHTSSPSSKTATNPSHHYPTPFITTRNVFTHPLLPPAPHLYCTSILSPLTPISIFGTFYVFPFVPDTIPHHSTSLYNVSQTISAPGCFIPPPYPCLASYPHNVLPYTVWTRPLKSIQNSIHTLQHIAKVFHIAGMQWRGPVVAYSSLHFTAEEEAQPLGQIRHRYNLIIDMEAIDKALISQIQSDWDYPKRAGFPTPS